jgi:hypothetical protein
VLPYLNEWSRLAMILLVMPPERVPSEIIFQIAPDGVDVVGVVLGVVVLDQERRPLESDNNALARLGWTRPGER